MADQHVITCSSPRRPEIKNNLAQVTPYSRHALPILASVADGYWDCGWTPHPWRIDSFHPPAKSSRPIWYWTWLKTQDCPPGLPWSTSFFQQQSPQNWMGHDGSHTCWYMYALGRSKVWICLNTHGWPVLWVCSASPGRGAANARAAKQHSRRTPSPGHEGSRLFKVYTD